MEEVIPVFQCDIVRPVTLSLSSLGPLNASFMAGGRQAK
jgi:hypothetical protein